MIENKINKIETERENTIREMLADFKDYRFNYTDEIPEEMVFSDDLKTGKRYKCRAHFFLNIASRISSLEHNGIITDRETLDRYDRYDEFLVKVITQKTADSATRSESNTRITREEIDKANTILDSIISDLEKLK